MKSLIKLGLYLLLSLKVFSANAQQNLNPIKKNTIFIEALGNGGFYSFNYDRILVNREKWKLAGRVGYSYFNSFNSFKDRYHTVPLEFSFLRGKGRHFLEIGLGITPMYRKYYFGWPGEETTTRDLDFLLLTRIGYRYQKQDGGVFYKIGWTPAYELNYPINHHWFPSPTTAKIPWLLGLAIGYTIK